MKNTFYCNSILDSEISFNSNPFTFIVFCFWSLYRGPGKIFNHKSGFFIIGNTVELVTLTIIPLLNRAFVAGNHALVRVQY